MEQILEINERFKAWGVKLLSQFLKWRLKHISNKNFLVISSIIVGLVAGLAAVILKVFVHYIQVTLQESESAQNRNLLFFFFPLIGILLTVLYVQVFRNGKLGRGISNILLAISKKQSNVPPDKMHSHIVSSGITVGFGGSAGLEAPIVVTGSAIGSNIAKILKLNTNERTLLLASGAAAGISAVFNSPIAGVIFAMEILLAEFTIPAFIPLLIASATAAVVSNVLYSEKLFFLITRGWNIEALPFYIMLGLLTGMLSVYLTRTTLKVEGLLNSWKETYKKAISGGIILGIMIFLLPPLYGEGYITIKQLLDGDYDKVLANSFVYDYVGHDWAILAFVGIIILVKIIATSITIGSGGNGGIFAPSLFTGALTGFFFSYGVNMTGLSILTIPNFIVVGMAGVLSGVVHAPLTAIFLIAEVTGGYALFVPLMIVSALSYFIARYLEPYTVYTKKLALKGHLANGNKDRAVLNQMKLRKLIETDFNSIKSDMFLGELVEIISQSKRNIFPVLDDKNMLIGIISLDNIRDVMFQQEQYKLLKVENLMTAAPAIIDINCDMQKVMDAFEDYKAWNLPVAENGIYVGFVSKSKIFTDYRNLLIRHAQQMEQL
jgi:chloride channel protein, CIC family